MSKRARETAREPGRNRLAGSIFSLLPAAAILGLLAPGLIETQLVAVPERSVPAEPQRTTAWQPQHFKSPLLLVPGDRQVDRGIDLVELRRLVERVTRAIDRSQELAAAPAATDPEPSFEEVLVAQAPEHEPFYYEEELEEEEIFRRMLEPELTVDLSPAWFEELDVIEWDRYGLGAGFSLFVDFAGPAQFTSDRPPLRPVPEPGPAALLAIGLTALALHRRASRG